MRLVCPSCAAEYEVMAAAIGAKGRMVRCTSCATEWFQSPETPETAADAAPPAPAPAPEPKVEAPAAEPAPKTEAPVAKSTPRVEIPAASPELAPKPDPEPKADPATVEDKPELGRIIGGEPMSEPVAVRRAEVETQRIETPKREPEPKPAGDALGAAAASMAGAREEAAAKGLARISMPPATEPAPVQPPQAPIYFDEDALTARSEVVDETVVEKSGAPEPEALTASMRRLEADAEPSGGGGAFLAGFATVTLLALIAIAAYVKAPDIAEMLPAAKGPLDAYAAAIDSGRVALAQAVND